MGDLPKFWKLRLPEWSLVLVWSRSILVLGESQTRSHRASKPHSQDSVWGGAFPGSGNFKPTNALIRGVMYDLPTLWLCLYWVTDLYSVWLDSGVLGADPKQKQTKMDISCPHP